MTNQARWSYVVLAITLVLIGLLQLGAPFLALLFSYFVLAKLGRYIPNKWVTLAIFILIVAGIGYAAVHFIRAAINALPTIADKSVPSVIALAEKYNFDLPFEDFEGLKATAMTTVKDQARYLGDFANFARHASTTFVFIIIAIVCAVSLFFNSRLDLFRESHKVLNSKIIGARIRNPIWLTLIGLIIGEKLMGVPGMILSPVVLNYLRVEMSKIEVRSTTTAPSGQPAVERIERAS